MIFPRQRIPSSKKTKEWRQSNLDWAEKTLNETYDEFVNDGMHATINYDLYAGILHKEDIEKTLNPDMIRTDNDNDSGDIVDNIQHYPIINKYINKLLGEFDSAGKHFSSRVTNPDAISEIERNKQAQFYQMLMSRIQNMDMSDEEIANQVKDDVMYMQYEYQDFHEIWCNCILKHYQEQESVTDMFTQGALDACLVGREFYHAYIVGGEPKLERIDPRTIRLYRRSSNKAEDADIVVITEYWSPSKINETYFDSLSAKDMDKIEEWSNTSVSSMDNQVAGDQYFQLKYNTEGTSVDYKYRNPFDNSLTQNEPVDSNGNIRVIRMFWKSYDIVKQIKRPNPDTGEYDIEYFSESYVADKDAGEEEKIFWVNRAWEGTKIGKDIYINIQPIQYQLNSISNPANCSLGIVGQIYSLNGYERHLSMMDIMKPYAYLYDVVHDKLNKVIGRDFGNPMPLDFAFAPKDWDFTKWISVIKNLGVYPIDSFKENPNNPGQIAGMMQSAIANIAKSSSPEQVAKYSQLLTIIDDEVGSCIGMNRQRLGETGLREAAQSIDNAEAASSDITAWLMNRHFDCVRRAYELLINVSKVCIKGKSKKFEYILPDKTKTFIEIDGNQFYECDYGIVMVDDNENKFDSQELYRLAQAGIQNGTAKLSTLFKVRNTKSIGQQQAILENAERNAEQQAQQLQQQQNELLAQQQQQVLEAEQRKYQFEIQKLQMENDTKIKIAEINAEAEKQRFIMGDFGNIRKNDAQLKIAEMDVEFKREKAKEENELKKDIINSEVEKSKAETELIRKEIANFNKTINTKNK